LFEGVQDDERQFDIVVGGKDVGPDDIDVRLQEFAVAALLRTFAAPGLLDLIAAERKVEMTGILQHIPGERNGEVEVQAEVVTGVGRGMQTADDVHLFVDLALARQLVQRLDGAGLDRCETVEFERPAQTVEDGLLDDPATRQELGKAGQCLGSCHYDLFLQWSDCRYGFVARS
jgi:hypothetical protein